MSEVDISPAGNDHDQQHNEKHTASQMTSSEDSESPADKGAEGSRMAQDEGSSQPKDTNPGTDDGSAKRSLETISNPTVLGTALANQQSAPSTPKRDQFKASPLPGRPPLSPKVKLRRELSGGGVGGSSSGGGGVNKKSVIPFVHDPSKVTLKFLFANKDGLSVELQFKPSDTVGEVKGTLLSMWPEALPKSSNGDGVRLICMGKGILMPDTRSLKECEVPVFETHATPINVSVRPPNIGGSSSKKGDTDDKKKNGNSSSSNANNSSGSSSGGGNNRSSSGNSGTNTTVEQGCACVIL